MWRINCHEFTDDTADRPACAGGALSADDYAEDGGKAGYGSLSKMAVSAAWGGHGAGKFPAGISEGCGGGFRY